MRLDVFESIRATRPGVACDWLDQSVVATLGNGLGSIGAVNEHEGPTSADGTAPPQDWDALIAQARQAACGPGEAETQVRPRAPPR